MNRAKTASKKRVREGGRFWTSWIPDTLQCFVTGLTGSPARRPSQALEKASSTNSVQCRWTRLDSDRWIRPSER